MIDTQTVGIALVGCGTVGGAAAALLLRDRDLLAGRSGLQLDLRHVVDQDFTRAREVGVPEDICRTDLAEALADEQTHIVVELVGGEGFAKECVERALAAGKSVVTANKALLAKHGAELHALARKSGGCIAFEGSCVGGVPVIGSLTGGLVANDIDALVGIVNGTCNYILTHMSQRGAEYADVLAEAQQAGLAEMDPTLDVSGGDSAHKLAILAALAFGRRIDFDAISVEGIESLHVDDIRFGAELGYAVKLLAIASRQGDAISLRVHPAFIRRDHPLARVAGPFNAVCVYGHAVGHTMYYGRGAGGPATASAVVADIVDVASGNALRRFEQLGIWPDRSEPAKPLDLNEITSRYYLHVTCADSPGVLGQIADVLGRHDISIASVLQHEPLYPGSQHVPLIITTYEANEGNLTNALAEINALPVTTGSAVVIRIVAEHPEAQV
ncbi:MAG: homoserine dehydrogenase [Planctomycetota bacterium]|jgi:homoserine dehydrogenase